MYINGRKSYKRIANFMPHIDTRNNDVRPWIITEPNCKCKYKCFERVTENVRKKYTVKI